jgi:hypothetical protein
MNRHQKHPSPRLKNPAYRQAFERLDAALERYGLPDLTDPNQARMAIRRIFGLAPENVTFQK